jgi:hypothetical protein
VAKASSLLLALSGPRIYLVLGCETDLRSSIGSTTSLIIGPKRCGSWIYCIYFVAAMPAVDGDAQLLGRFYSSLSLDHLERRAFRGRPRAANVAVL